MKKNTDFLGIFVIFMTVLAMNATTREVFAKVKAHPSIFVRYQFDVSEVIAELTQAQGHPLDSKSPATQWLDEMGWRKWVKEYAAQPFQLTASMKEQLQAQDRFLKDSFSYRSGDVVWVPAEKGEQPYGHSSARVNPRGQIQQIIAGEKETFFLVDVGVDNGSSGGMHTAPGKYYDGRTGPVLTYGPNYAIEKKRYVYSLSEMERYNAAFRSQSVGADTGASVDYSKDTKWLEKINAFKEKIVSKGIEIDFTKPAEIYKAQRSLILEIFRHFKMNRNAPSGGPLLGEVASGGGACFTQACVLAHAVHAVGEPYGIKAMNISGATVNPTGGHGFVRLTVRGPEEVHVYDLTKDASGKTIFRGMEIKSNMINVISDPGWADYGKTEDFFAAMPVETAINPIPVDANRALHDLLQGKSFEEVVVHYGGKGPMMAQGELKGELFHGSRQAEFLAPVGQIAEATKIEQVFSGELQAMVGEARGLKAKVLGEPTGSLRGVKSRILADIVESRVAASAGGLMNGMSADTARILLTEYLFRAVK